MGYKTWFRGSFALNKPLSTEDYIFLDIFNKVHSFDNDFEFQDYFLSARDQPQSFCCWKPSKDRCSIVWDGNLKFYYFSSWIKYLIKYFFNPKGYILDGLVIWIGQDELDDGELSIISNEVFTFSKYNYKGDGFLSTILKNGINLQ